MYVICPSRLADKLIDQAVNEVASELAEFCETVADQMYSAEFVTWPQIKYLDTPKEPLLPYWSIWRYKYISANAKEIFGFRLQIWLVTLLFNKKISGQDSWSYAINEDKFWEVCQFISLKFKYLLNFEQWRVTSNLTTFAEILREAYSH